MITEERKEFTKHKGALKRSAFNSYLAMLNVGNVKGTDWLVSKAQRQEKHWLRTKTVADDMDCSAW